MIKTYLKINLRNFQLRFYFFPVRKIGIQDHLGMIACSIELQFGVTLSTDLHYTQMCKKEDHYL